ncbi:MAG TPA: hypothetical protein VHN16_14435 [Streptosporangiaceae bacterium]|jgi:Mn-dependent DtxR family transcriptional regulator|nr:hypothetical protein [Streptosporangiaceae bacterium]
MSRIPMPLTAEDRAAGYWWELSLRQVEVSRTIVFDVPRQTRAFFGALIADNLDLGRPSYDLARLSRNGLITRIPRRNLYALTPDGLRFTIFYTKGA